MWRLPATDPSGGQRNKVFGHTRARWNCVMRGEGKFR
jgi:hypothetical protein